MKADQIAIYVQNDQQSAAIKRYFGLEQFNWVEDNVVGTATVFGVPDKRIEAKLQFCYDLFSNTEFELITVLGFSPFHAYTVFPQYEMNMPFICHLGFHVDEFPETSEVLAQDMITETHTNPKLIELGRHYHYRVYDTRLITGTFTKYIKRLDP